MNKPVIGQAGDGEGLRERQKQEERHQGHAQLAYHSSSGRRLGQAVETSLLPVHLQQLRVYVSPFNKGYIVLEIVARASYDTHEVEKVA